MRWAARWWLDQDPSRGIPETFTNFSHHLFTVSGPHPRDDEHHRQSSFSPGPDSPNGGVPQSTGHKAHVPPMGALPVGGLMEEIP